MSYYFFYYVIRYKYNINTPSYTFLFKYRNYGNGSRSANVCASDGVTMYGIMYDY